MKERLLNGWKNMQEKFKNCKSRVLEVSELVQYHNRKFILAKDTVVLDVPNEELAKIIIMEDMLDRAIKKGIISISDLVQIAEEIHGKGEDR